MLRRGRKKDDSEQGSPHWMTTFSDMMTLLLVFFVMLYSLSVIDEQKLHDFLVSFRGAGILDRGDKPMEEIEPPQETVPNTEISPPEDLEVEQMIPQENTLPEVYLMVKKYISENGLEDMVEVSYERRGVALEIKEHVLFASGKADLRQRAKELLDPLAGLLEQIENRISVEGHTDNRPIQTVEFPTNWELSTARSCRVIRYFVDNHGLDPKKFAAVGFGEYHPVAPNNSQANMARNRRVIIVINARDPYASEVYYGD